MKKLSVLYFEYSGWSSAASDSDMSVSMAAISVSEKKITKMNNIIEQQHEISRSACPYVHFDQSLCLSLKYSIIIKLLAKRDLEILSLTRDCTGWSESTLVKMPRLIFERKIVIIFFIH